MSSDVRRVKGTSTKELVKAFEGLCGRHGRWEVWSDWITMSACAISNAVDIAHREDREKLYQKYSEKYSAAELDSMGQMFGMVVASLDENPEQDMLGALYMVLELGNDHAGQFFTPYNICRTMAELNVDSAVQDVERKGWISVADPACGAGALMIAFANACRRKDLNYQQSVLFVGQDIDFTVGMMCYIQLSLLGCSGYIVIGDTLAHPATSIDQRGLLPRDDGNVWYMPMYFRDIWTWRKLISCMEGGTHDLP